MSPRSIVVGFAHVTGFVVLSFVWVMVVALTVVWFADVDPAILGSPRDYVEALGPGLLGTSTAIQGAGLAALALGASCFLPQGSNHETVVPAGAEALRSRWRAAFALRRVQVVWLVTAVAAAVTVGWFPSWLFEQLLRSAPAEYEPTMVLITEQLLSGGTALGRAALLGSIVLCAPVFEELVFRGYLWAALERVGPPSLAWLGTSLLFAAYHQDPAQVIALLPTSLFLGWLRFASGSVWPSVAAHFVNNALSAVTLLTIEAQSDASMPLWLAALGCAITLTTCAAGSSLARSPAGG